MRILIVSQYFWPESFRINEVASSLLKAGADVTVLTGQPNYPEGRTFEGYRSWGMGWDRGATAYSIARVPLFPRGRGGAASLILNYLSFVVSAAVFGSWLLRAKRYDVILVFAVSPIMQAIPAIWLKWIKRAPLVVWVQDLWPESLEATGYVKNRFILSVVARLTRWIYRRSNLLLGQSHSFVDAITPMAGGVRVEYYPTPGSIDVFGVGPLALSLPAAFNVVFAGNLGTAQALPTIVQCAFALKSRKDIRFVLVGDGSQREWLAEEIERHGLDNVILAGRFPSEAIPGILAQASALLVTLNQSDATAKVIPAKISSYLAAGKPIIAAIDGEGARVIKESGAGIACAAADATALAEAVAQLAETSLGDREIMGLAGRAYFDAHFEPHMLTRRLVALFNETIAQVKGNGPKPNLRSDR